MSFFNTLERNVFFSLTRLFALLVVAILTVALLGAAAYMAFARQGGASRFVAPVEVIEAIRPKVVAEQSSDGVIPPPVAPVDRQLLPGLKLSFALQKQFSSPENIRILNRWLEASPEKERQEFLDELSNVVMAAEGEGLDTTSAINKYHQMKVERITQANAAKIVDRADRLTAAGIAAGALALIAMFSLILVLLAIERNTREVVKT